MTLRDIKVNCFIIFQHHDWVSRYGSELMTPLAKKSIIQTTDKEKNDAFTFLKKVVSFKYR
jgi:hypothetical protein